jgi:L-lactate dehydrogenase (cytochrome)
MHVRQRASVTARRRVPRWSDLAPLLGLRRPALTRAARVAAAPDILELRRLGRRRAPRAVFDYADGGAEREVSLRRSRRAFREVELQPRVLRDVAEVDLSQPILGRRSALPIVLAPVGFTRMLHTDGERAVARVAAAHDVPYALSTMGTTSPEQLAAAVPEARRWFQLYVWQDRGASEELVARAREHGYEALVLTVDNPVAGARMRDVHNGLTIPPRLTVTTLVDMALHPAWWFDLLTTEPLRFATLTSFAGTVAQLADRIFDPSVTIDDLKWLRERWDGPIVVKGIQTVDDAKLVVEHGADALVVSNHGGRQLDRSPTPLLQLPRFRDALGDEVEIHVDGGVLSGADVAIALAAGADAVLLGRSYLYGLLAGGQAGVDRALTIITEELRRTLQLLGVAAVAELTPDHVRLPGGP